MPSSPTPRTRPPLEGAFAVAEEIASRDLNNLFLTSCYFSDAERYRAFCAMYAVMRLVDDRIDAIPSRKDLGDAERKVEHGVVDAWSRVLESVMAGETPNRDDLAACDSPIAGTLAEASAEALAAFPVPPELWRNFFAAMHRDIERPRFATYREFLDYTEGASVAPTTIYLFLIVAAPEAPGGPYLSPGDFDLIRCGRELGTFAYLAHILRDLGKDLATGDEGLLYLAADDLRQHRLDEQVLRADLAAQRSSAPLRALAADLAARSRQHLDSGRSLFSPLDGLLTPDRDFILQLIVTIYEEVLVKIASRSYDVLDGDRHRLTFEEKHGIARRLAARHGFEI